MRKEANQPGSAFTGCGGMGLVTPPLLKWWSRVRSYQQCDRLLVHLNIRTVPHVLERTTLKNSNLLVEEPEQVERHNVPEKRS